MTTDLALGDVVVRAEGADRAVPERGGVVVDGNPIRLPSPVPVRRFYRHGWQSWSPTRWVDVSSPVAPIPVAELRAAGDDPVYALREVHGGSGVGAVDCGQGRVLLVGALEPGARVEVRGDTLHAATETPGGSWFVAHGDEETVFAHYADLLAERLGRRKRPAPRVWSSWYSLYRDISEQRLLAVLADLAGFKIELFQIDDGWQHDIGDWHPNDAFPSGMDGMATAIRDRGYEPGLWLAPFIAGAGSVLAAQHPEFLVTDDDGAPVRAGFNWGGYYHPLDLTHPGARDFVADLVRTAVAWGYRYLKLDFLFAGALPGRRHRDVPRETAYRQGVELVRDAAGEDTYLLACGAPVIASIGVFDGLRIGPDVAPWWEIDHITRYLHDLSLGATRYAIATSLHRLWLQPVIDTDPDVAYFRTRDCLLSAQQRAWLQDLARICDFRATSDPPDWLSSDERDALAAFFDDSPAVRRTGRYRFRVGGRDVDFTAVAAADPDFR